MFQNGGVQKRSVSKPPRNFRLSTVSSCNGTMWPREVIGVQQIYVAFLQRCSVFASTWLHRCATGSIQSLPCSFKYGPQIVLQLMRQRLEHTRLRSWMSVRTQVPELLQQTASENAERQVELEEELLSCFLCICFDVELRHPITWLAVPVGMTNIRQRISKLFWEL